MEANSVITHLGKIEHQELFGITSACDAIHAQNNICLAHPDSCEVNQRSTANYEQSIKVHSENLQRTYGKKSVLVSSLKNVSINNC